MHQGMPVSCWDGRGKHPKTELTTNKLLFEMGQQESRVQVYARLVFDITSLDYKNLHKSQIHGFASESRHVAGSVAISIQFHGPSTV